MNSNKFGDIGCSIAEWLSMLMTGCGPSVVLRAVQSSLFTSWSHSNLPTPFSFIPLEAFLFRYFEFKPREF